MKMARAWCAGIFIAGAMLGAACGGSSAPATDRTEAPVSASAPAATPPASSTATASGQAFKVGDVFPPGKGRELVLDTCGSCHSVGCSARDQRTADRWDSIKQGHRDKVTGLASADFDTLFAYLKENFNDKRPEPAIPAEFLQQGCTPY